MDKIIIFNVGSSSCKFQIFTKELEVIGKGMIERIGIEGTNVCYKKPDGTKITDAKDIVFDELEEYFTNFLETNNIVNMNDVYLMSHRVVNGGEKYFDNFLIEDIKDIEELEALNSLAPLHNPYNNSMLRSMYEKYPNAKHVVCFDTAFHSTIPAENYLYPVPLKLYEENGIRKFGAHGSSHAYITEVMEAHLNKPVNIINLHLGNGASACVTKNSKSINTSMGFTPLAGLMMGTRTGDIDPSIVLYLINDLGMNPKEVDKLLIKESGLLGISGVSSDMREIKKAVKEGNEEAILARELYSKRIADTISMYLSEVDYVDAITFTGGIGENDSSLIAMVMDKVRILNTEFVDEINKDKDINLLTTEESDIPVYIVPTNEELYMAKVGKRLIGEEV